jgi:hypothetical protein
MSMNLLHIQRKKRTTKRDLRRGKKKFASCSESDLIVVENFLILRRPCKKYAFAPVTENCQKKQIPCLPLSHILLLVFLDSETLKENEKSATAFFHFLSTSDTQNV